MREFTRNCLLFGFLDSHQKSRKSPLSAENVNATHRSAIEKKSTHSKCGCLSHIIEFSSHSSIFSLHPVVALLWHSSSMKVHWRLKKIVWQRNGRNLIHETMTPCPQAFELQIDSEIWIYQADSFHCYWTVVLITRKTVMRISPARRESAESANLLIIVKWKLPTSLDGPARPVVRVSTERHIAKLHWTNSCRLMYQKEEKNEKREKLRKYMSYCQAEMLYGTIMQCIAEIFLSAFRLSLHCSGPRAWAKTLNYLFISLVERGEWKRSFNEINVVCCCCFFYAKSIKKKKTIRETHNVLFSISRYTIWRCYCSAARVLPLFSYLFHLQSTVLENATEPPRSNTQHSEEADSVCVC